MPNAELAAKILKIITTKPESYDQETWGRARVTGTGESCGTTCCIAGHACILDGAVLVDNEGRTAEDVVRYLAVNVVPTNEASWVYATESRPLNFALKNGLRREVSIFAADALDVPLYGSYGANNSLFHPDLPRAAALKALEMLAGNEEWEDVHRYCEDVLSGELEA